MDKEELYCPFLKENCIGKKCAMAVTLNHPLVSPYNIVYHCGLIHTYDIYKHGESIPTAIERKQDRW